MQSYEKCVCAAVVTTSYNFVGFLWKEVVLCHYRCEGASLIARSCEKTMKGLEESLCFCVKWGFSSEPNLAFCL